MIIMNIRGGMGNQLFQYALAYTLSKDQNTTMIQDLSQYAKGYFRGYQLDKFQISHKESFAVTDKNRLLSILKRTIKIGRPYLFIKETKGYTTYDENVVVPRKLSTYYMGLWQSNKYFDKYREELAKEFQPNFTFSKAANDLKEKIVQDQESVAVHIRRGDYIQVNGCISLNYYKEAISEIKKKWSKARFYFFSDDIEWVKNQFGFGEEFIYASDSERINDLEEFFIMSAAHKHIIANSTFSWWAAYLNLEKTNVVYAPEVANWRGYFYPEEWNLIPTEIVKG